MRAIAIVTGLLLAGCSSASPPAATSAPPSPNGSAHDLVTLATSCWMGGLWSDALGEKGDARSPGIERRCEALLDVVGPVHVPGGHPPHEGYFALRAIEPGVVELVARRVEALASGNAADAPHAADLVALLRGIADAARETNDARRAADVEKEDVAVRAPGLVGAADREAAAAKLESGGALDALFHLDAGPFTREARTVALLTALDRMEIARGLPKHLKVFAVRTAYVDVFGVSAPLLVGDAAAPIPSGTWLAYLTQVAAAAGHPVPDDARDPQNREPLAWQGVLEGFADKLRADEARGGRTLLAAVERAIAGRLDQQFRDGRTLYQAHSPQDR
jgi:hypothetical protein